MDRRIERTTEDADRYRQGLSLYCSGRPGEAAEMLGELRNREDLVGRLGRYYEGLSHRCLGIEAMQEGQFAQAEQHFRRAVTCLGRRADLVGYLCGIYVDRQRIDRCADELDWSVEQGDQSPETWRKLAQAQWQAGRREQALMTLGKALRTVGPQGALLMQLGLFHAAEERFDQAMHHLACAARVAPARPEIHMYLGLAAAGAGQTLQAVRSLQRAWELRPGDTTLALQLALCARAAAESGHAVVVRPPEQMQAADADSHIRQLAAYVRSEPDFVDAMLALAPSDADAELLGLLACVLQAALAGHDGYADLHHRASKVMLRLDRTEAALAHARRAVDINPRYVQALLHLGRLCDRADQPDEAIACVEAAIGYGADWPDVHCLAGELMSRNAMASQAREHLGRALELKANYTRASQALAALAA